MHGLTSSADFNAACSFPSRIVPGVIYPCAFPDIKPNAPPLLLFKPIGRSVYNGLQTKLAQNVQHPFRRPGVRARSRSLWLSIHINCREVLKLPQEEAV